MDSPQVSYVISSSEGQGEAAARRRRSSLWEIAQQGHDFIRTRPSRGRILVVILLIGMVVVVGFVGLHYVWRGRSLSNWDTVTMGRLQPVLLEQVRSLMVTANRSIHDLQARLLLRNLSKQDNHTCYSPNCLHTGLTMLESMNFSIDPCEDFYEFACGSWSHLTDNESPSTSSRVIINTDQFSKINEKVIKATQKILEAPASENEFRAFTIAKQFYTKCKDLDQLEKDGLVPLATLINTYGNWPILNTSSNSSSPFNLMLIAADMQRLSNSALISIEVKQHPTNPLTNIIYIVHPKFFMAKEYLVTPEKYPRLIAAYKDFILGLAKELQNYGRGVVEEQHPGEMEAQADEIIKFESKLARLSLQDDLPGIRWKKAVYQIDKLQKETDFTLPKNPAFNNKVDWIEFIRRVFLSSGVDIGEEERVIVQEIAYIRGLSPLLASVQSKTIHNYMMFRLISKFTTGTTATLRELHLKFYSTVYGMKNIPPRSSTCSTVVKDAFAFAIGMKIVQGVSDLSSKREVEEIVEKVRFGMERMLSRQKLGPALLLIGISRKLSTLKHCIGYPASFLNSSLINQFYESLPFTISEDVEVYLMEYIQLRYWLYDKTLIALRLPFDSDCWGGSSLANIGEAYAYYDTARNSINFPIGLIQAPFFRHHVPLPINYGAIGAIIGHEISHSINLEGWIKVKLVQELDEYWECLVSHYSSYEVPELSTRVNGLRTRSENLADHLGLAASYWAYQLLHADPSEQTKTLAGLDLFTPDQLFYLSFSHMWCVSGPEEWLADELESSSHTPGKYRVIGSLQNSDDFARAWNCPLGSKMNPEQKCKSFITTGPPIIP